MTESADSRKGTAHVEDLEREVARLRGYESTFHLVIGGAENPVLILDRGDGTVREANPAAVRRLGRSRAEMLGRKPGELSAGTSAERAQADAKAWDDALAGKVRKFAWVLRTPAGDDVELDVTAHRVELEGRACLFVVLRDVSRHALVTRERDEFAARYAALIDIAPVAVIISTDRLVDYANAAALALFAAPSLEALAGKRIEELVEPQFHAELDARVRAASSLGARSPRFEHRIRRLDGGSVEVDSVAAPVMFNGRISRQTILWDVTERRDAQRALAESERRYRMVSEAATDYVFEVEPAGEGVFRLRWATESISSVLGGAASSEIRLDDALRLAGPRGGDAVQRLARAVVSGQRATVEIEIASPAGTTHWARVTVRPSDEPGGGPRALGFGRDITAERESERALRESEARYREVATLASDVVFELDEYRDGSARLRWCTDVAAFGPAVRAHELAGPAAWEALVHPDDRPQRAVRSRNLWAGETDEREWRWLRADGSVRWMRTVERPRGLRAGGETLRVIGAARDITVLKLAAEKEETLRAELRRAQEKLEENLLAQLDLADRPTRVVRGGAHEPEPLDVGPRGAHDHVQELAELAATHREPVLITGETGTGKGHLAQWIHDHGPHRAKPFVAVNCSSLRGDLLLSELFGSARGAYTSAASDRRGLVEEADGGTLFLDEIGDMEPAAQAMLLKVIEEKTLRRLGETRLRRSEFRLICATHRDLARAATEGRFRQDLYYRINVFPIVLPSLRERPGEIPGLLRHLLTSLAAPQLDVPATTIEFLARQPWPGNIRELRNAIIRAVLLARGGPLLPRHFPGLDRPPSDSPPAPAQPPSPALATPRARDVMLDEDALGARIRESLTRHEGNRSRVAKELGVSRTTLYRYLERLGLA